MLPLLLTAVLASADGGVGLTVEFAPGAFDTFDAGAGAVEAAPPPAPAPAPAPAPPPVEAPDAGADEVHAAAPVDAGAEATAQTSPVTLRGAAEAEVALLPSGFAQNELDGFVALRPVFSFTVGDDFTVEVGPTFRLRLIDRPPDNWATDFGGVLRRPDWDEASDFGQIIQALRIAPDSSPFYARAGTVRKKTLGLGHLINRYSNQENADYHPAMGNVVLVLGPVRGEFFASDVFGGRLFAGDVTLDLGGVFSSSPEVKDRYLVSLELVHDAGRAGLPFRPDPSVDRVTLPQVTLMHVDGSAVLLRNQNLRLMVLLGMGTRFTQRADLGFVLGGAVDATVSDIGISAKLEARKQGGGFRHGFFGPNYELSRFADVGFSGPGIADVLLPDSFSFYGEVKVGIGTAASVDVAAEYFLYNRTDLDASLNVNLLGSWLVGQARFTVVGLGQQGRYHVTAGVRARLFKSFYLVGSGGTAFFPQPDGSLLRGVTASAGAGVDFER